ncbi:glutathione S-transferase N-terminal domain-containing protein [Nisaea acidiphila]|uniref:Glutathione S-transferase N-terminal domain-containing protein n=1 Tax=Nisaea acidiphila TaxID=1862145 RepID=A0A9J7ATT0_9PROT|nr:glutathione S-transferase N-terminal domain-containing protein [Nisaea acidiphila]UUX50760.1 glutathione S-transferase N-terminal domain-containing protein [Nisaea acidiphila]
MAITFYDLSAKNGARFSPYGWRARMALAHKGLEEAATVEHVRFGEKEKLEFSGQKLVPVLKDADTVVCDSWDIACYLEDTYPDAPSLFGGEAGRGGALFVTEWANRTITPLIAGLIVHDVLLACDERDKDYFRESREARFGRKLEEVQAGREERLPDLHKALAPARGVIEKQPYLGGTGPSYADYALFGTLMWARISSPFELLSEEDPLWGWRERLLDAHGGAARKEAPVSAAA